MPEGQICAAAAGHDSCELMQQAPRTRRTIEASRAHGARAGCPVWTERPPVWTERPPVWTERPPVWAELDQFGRNSDPRKPASIISHFLGRDHLRRLSHDAPDRPSGRRSAAELVWAGRSGRVGMGRLPGKYRIGARTACAACAWGDTYVENAAGAGGAARFDGRAPC